MWDAAVAVARAVGYIGVGTVEYLVDASGFFFLEMNTRLQVEHGVTELITGLDLVGLQLAVAAGQPLALAQSDVGATGHAVEVRLCAERPRDDYRPTPGTTTYVRWSEGPGLRTDRGVESGSVVSTAYDSLVAKLMALGPDRAEAVARLSRALRALELDGLETNRELLGAVLDDTVFRDGQAHVHYLDNRPDLRDAVLPDETRWRHAAAAACRLTSERAARSLVPLPAAGWRNIGSALHADELTDDVGTLQVRATVPGEPVRVQVDGEWHAVGTARAHDDVVDLAADGLRRRYRVRLSAHRADVNGPEGQSSFALRTADDSDERGGLAGECRAPLPGAVTKVLVAEGDVVAEGDGLVVLEAMKMEHTLRGQRRGDGGPGALRARPAGRRARSARHRGARMSAPDVLRIGNCSGFFGDRTGAAREMVDGGPLDVLTGDWLAELTMYILHKTRQRSGGYARTFLRELEEVLPTCIERGITVVSNAGGLQPEASGRGGGGAGPDGRGSTCTWPRSRGTTSRPAWGRCRRKGRSSSTSTPARCCRPAPPS